MIPFLDLKAENRSLETEIEDALRAVLKSGFYILGENVEAFECEFAAYCNRRYAVGVGSGTSALRLALMVEDIGSGDEVITVSFTAPSTVLAISEVGARPVFVDIESVFTMDPDNIEAAISSRTKAIIPVHLYGHPADMDPILEIADRHGLIVIEDACQAHGAEYKKKKVGSFGKLACFSFYPTKNLGGFGDGGMIVTDSQRIYQKLLILRNLGLSDRDHLKEKGINSRLDEMQAACLRIKLKYLDQRNEKRRKLARDYSQELPESIIPLEAPYANPVYHLYVIRTPIRDALKACLSKKGIETLIHYPIPVHLQDAYLSLDMKIGSLPSSEQCAAEVLSLPFYPEIPKDHVLQIAAAIREFFNNWVPT